MVVHRDGPLDHAVRADAPDALDQIMALTGGLGCEVSVGHWMTDGHDLLALSGENLSHPAARLALPRAGACGAHRDHLGTFPGGEFGDGVEPRKKSLTTSGGGLEPTRLDLGLDSRVG